MPSPFVHSLLPPSCAMYSQKLATRRAKMKFAAISVMLANLPDFDFIPATFFCSNWSQAHRHFGHNLVSLSLCVFFGAWCFGRWLGFSKARGWTLSVALVGSHVLLDGMQGFGPNGVRPGLPLLWPLSNREARLPFALFRFIQTSHDENPIVTHLSSADFWGRVFLYEVVYILALFAIWAIAWRTVRAITAHARSSAADSFPQTHSQNPEAPRARASA